METVLLTVPTRGQVYAETAQALSPYSPRYVIERQGIVSARNRCRALCLETEAQVLMMVDDDVVPSDAVFSHGLEPILGGQCDILIFACPIVRDLGVVMPNLYRVLDDNVSPPLFGYALRRSHKSGLAKIDAGGFGCVAITRRCLEKIGEFQERRDDSGQTILSEDLDYCLRARGLKLKVAADPYLICEHMLYLHGGGLAAAFAQFVDLEGSKVA